MGSRKKILFFSHAVTMAHFSRPLKWIESLDPAIYDIYLASHPSFKKLVPATGVTFLNISCIDAKEFSKIVNRALPIYDRATFENHVAEDLKIMQQVKPDLVIGDFRHSLSVSCRLQKIKYVNMANAYWSPDIEMPYPLPETSVVRALGETVANFVVSLFLPVVLKINFFNMVFKLRKSLRTAGLNFTDYRQVITDGDVTVYCDTESLIPLKKQTEQKTFVGPLLWSMPVALPSWWSQLDPKKKRVFLSLGSSGDAKVLPLIVKVLAPMNVEVIVALAGQRVDLVDYSHVHITDYLPMEAACEGSSLVICNGGSPMSHAALAAGVPCLGIVFNNDQLLNMSHVEQKGAGLLLRYWNLSEGKLAEAIREILTNPSFQMEAQKISEEFQQLDVKKTLRNIIDQNV